MNQVNASRTAPRLSRAAGRFLTPPRIFILSFAGVIAAGTLALLIPGCAAEGRLSFLDALFTSTSGVCVTGLSVIHIGRDLSPAGQVVTLVLFQIGGLGILTFSLALFSLMGRSLPFKSRDIMQSSFFHAPSRDFLQILKWVLRWTLIIEVGGAALLSLALARRFPPGRALTMGAYHAVSAFNNCGFSLFPDSLVEFRGDWPVNLIVMVLIVLGGIGFLVQYELVSKLKRRRRRLSLHARVVLGTTAALILAGAVFVFVFESGELLRGAPLGEKILASVFQSVTARTGGFNTLPVAALTNTTILILMVLMFVGASPGSTGGGIKTTSFALLLVMIRGRLRRREDVSLLNRTIPREVVTRTVAIVLASAIIIFCATAFLLFLGRSGTAGALAGRQYFVEILFEAVSAFGTVGLSMGATAGLSAFQKAVIIATMFIGRIGPLTLAYSWASPRRGLVYAEESVMVG